MHRLQQAILQLALRRPIEGMSLREIGECIGERHPQKVKHHLNQLRAKGVLVRGDRSRSVELGVQSSRKGTVRMHSIPILGAANCGDPCELGVENLEGYLTVSPSMVPKGKRMFAVRAIGSSMNRANLDGKTIEDGDYVIVDQGRRCPSHGDYVLSIIAGTANVKRFFRDEENGCVVLVSESSQEFPPIYIHEKDYCDYMVNGLVVQVMKKIRNRGSHGPL